MNSNRHRKVLCSWSPSEIFVRIVLPIEGSQSMTALLYKKTEYPLKKLLLDIQSGHLALPDLQRPFVWPDTKVRDLLDSMYRGFPIGTLLFWEFGQQDGIHVRQIGANGQSTPHLLVIDGQQRLTGLYAVYFGVPVRDKSFVQRRIKIAFDPLEERFEVSNAFLAKDPRWIADISVLWRPETSLYALIGRYLMRRHQLGGLSPSQERQIEKAFQQLHALENYPFTVLEVSHDVDEERVAEIFVRVNSQGKSLKQSDFVLTLMSVYWDSGRAQLERFCEQVKQPPQGKEPSPFNRVWQPTPEQLLRTTVALAFRRSRLRTVYALLRGKDLETGIFTEEQRERQFQRLAEAQSKVLALEHWHDFLHVPRLAGFLRDTMIGSKTALAVTYALWLIARFELGLPDSEARPLLARWLFMALLTGRYAGSAETQSEEDLRQLDGIHSGRAFCERLQTIMTTVLTPDYWSVTLPADLTATASSTLLKVFRAAQVVLDAPVLYSTIPIRHVLDPTHAPPIKPVHDHHLFPRAFLYELGFTPQQANQLANRAWIEWRDNLAINDSPPDEYAPKLERLFSKEQLHKMLELNALPEHWYEYPYEEFLSERRRRMARLIEQAFHRIGR